MEKNEHFYFQYQHERTDPKFFKQTPKKQILELSTTYLIQLH